MHVEYENSRTWNVRLIGNAQSAQKLSFLSGHHVVHWSRWRALAVLIAATVLMACCADLSTENIEPLLSYSISQVCKIARVGIIHRVLKPGLHFQLAARCGL